MIEFFILTSSFLLRLLLSPYGSHPTDINDWVGWSNRLVEVGFSKFYDAWSDYLPGYLYVLWLLGNIKNFLYSLGLKIPQEVIYKFPAILADTILVFIAYKICNRYLSRKIALVIAAVFAFNPAIFANSTLWGQIDVLNTFFYILTFILLFKKRAIIAAICLAFALLLKPQGIFLLPFVFLLMIRERWALAEFFKGSLIFLLFFFGSFVPFSDKINLVKFILERYFVSLNQYQYTSLNAFNFWAIGQRWWIPDSQIWLGLPLQLWGMIIFIIISLIILINFWLKYKKSENRNLYFVFFSGGLIFLNSFIFLTRVHERLLLTPLIFLMLAAIFKKELWIFVGILSITYVANLYFSFVWITQNFRYVFNESMINIICAINIFVFVILLVILLKERFHFDDSKTA